MEQDREVKELALAEGWVVPGLVAVGEAEVLVEDPVEIASVRVVVHKQFINWGFPAMSRNAQSAARP
jgi:hypothetical protein